MATWSGTWNRSACAASIAATSAPARMRLRSTITARPMRSLPIRPTPATVMHRLIEHFQRIAPTWLLLDTDWSATKQAVPFLPHCSDIVTIGRVKWIEGSKHTGKDNHAWYRFDIRHKGGPVFHGRDQSEVIPSRRTRLCEQCGKRYERWQRSSSRFCSPACRQRAYRKRLSVTPSVTPAPNTAIEPSDPRKCFATSDTPMSRGSRRKAGSCCLHSMAHTTVSTRC